MMRSNGACSFQPLAPSAILDVMLWMRSSWKRASASFSSECEALDGVDAPRQPRQHRGLVAGAGADLQHLVGLLDLQRLGHQRHDLRLADGLALRDRQRLVLVGLVVEMRQHEVLARDALQRRQHARVGDARAPQAHDEADLARLQAHPAARLRAALAGLQVGELGGGLRQRRHVGEIALQRRDRDHVLEDRAEIGVGILRIVGREIADPQHVPARRVLDPLDLGMLEAAALRRDLDARHLLRRDRREVDVHQDRLRPGCRHRAGG